MIPKRFHGFKSKEEMQLVLWLKGFEQWDMKRIALNQLLGIKEKVIND